MKVWTEMKLMRGAGFWKRRKKSWTVRGLRSKQERMPRLDCEERQINETAHQLMRSSFVEIVHCGQFCFGDLKSRELIILWEFLSKVEYFYLFCPSGFLGCLLACRFED
ncbi:hypothetical protein NQZ68_004573 [Dissostichus eleginoides]|nr:hypothetical protein NQZ68_004573 [Dissostichus eleginoides]